MFLNMLFCQGKRERNLSEYSTGMLQRLKVAFGHLHSQSSLVLDEPTSNLDTKGKDWFNDMISRFRGDRTLIIASNEASDFKHCDQFIELNVSSWE